MTFPTTRHRRPLGRMEKRLAADEPRLESMFAILAMLTRHEAMPVIERDAIRSRWWQQAVIIMLAVVSVLLLGMLVPSRNMCGAAAAASGSARRPSTSAAACPPARANLRDWMFAR